MLCIPVLWSVFEWLQFWGRQQRNESEKQRNFAYKWQKTTAPLCQNWPTSINECALYMQIYLHNRKYTAWSLSTLQYVNNILVWYWPWLCTDRSTFTRRENNNQVTQCPYHSKCRKSDILIVQIKKPDLIWVSSGLLQGQQPRQNGAKNELNTGSVQVSNDFGAISWEGYAHTQCNVCSITWKIPTMQGLGT